MRQQKFIAILISFSCIFSSLEVTAKPQVLDKIVAIVDSEPILLSDIEERIKFIGRNTFIRNTYSVREQVLDELINERLQINLAIKLNIVVNPVQVEQALQSNLNRFTTNSALTEDTKSILRKSIHQQLMIQQVQYQEVPRYINISPEEVEKFLASSEGKKMLEPQYHIYHVLIDTSKTSKEYSHDELVDKLMLILGQDASFEKKQAEFSTYNGVRFTDLGWNKQDDMSSLFADKVPELKIGQTIQALKRTSSIHLIKLHNKRSLTDKNTSTQSKARHILFPANYDIEKIQTIRAEIISGKENFDVLARKVSIDKVSAAQGGDLGWVSSDTMVPEFSQVMQSSKLNEISEPFKSQFGWHILQVLDRRTIQQDIEEKINLLARNKLFEKKFPAAVKRWLANLQTQAYIEKKSM